MLGNRSDSAIERALRSELHRRGLRFRKHVAPLPELRCRPDIVFTRARIAVFVDGCFWHCCPIHASMPKANASYWKPKLEANVLRDRRNDSVLRVAGWKVLRFWAHEPIGAMADSIARVNLASLSSGARPGGARLADPAARSLGGRCSPRLR